MQEKHLKNAKRFAIISLSLMAGSFCLIFLFNLMPSIMQDTVGAVMMGSFCMMQIASFVLGILAVKEKPGALSIVALVVSATIIVLEILFIVFLIWSISMACGAIGYELGMPDSGFWHAVHGCGEIG